MQRFPAPPGDCFLPIQGRIGESRQGRWIEARLGAADQLAPKKNIIYNIGFQLHNLYNLVSTLRIPKTYENITDGSDTCPQAANSV
jgi:hypothetical protein